MSHRTFRDFIAVAEQQGLLRRVQQTVDASWEPGCLIKWAFQALSDEERFGLLFENVEGSSIPLLINAYGSEKRMATALGVADIEEIAGEIERLRHGAAGDHEAPHPINIGLLTIQKIDRSARPVHLLNVDVALVITVPGRTGICIPYTL